ncbi:32843_t:CDS:1, partial [Racocetra persica]
MSEKKELFKNNVSKEIKLEDRFLREVVLSEDDNMTDIEFEEDLRVDDMAEDTGPGLSDIEFEENLHVGNITENTEPGLPNIEFEKDLCVGDMAEDTELGLSDCLSKEIISSELFCEK